MPETSTYSQQQEHPTKRGYSSRNTQQRELLHLGQPENIVTPKQHTGKDRSHNPPDPKGIATTLTQLKTQKICQLILELM
jgi:hypothetical protein